MFHGKKRIPQPLNKFEVQNAKINQHILYRKLHPKNPPFEYEMEDE